MSDLVGEIDIILHENKQLREQNRVLATHLNNLVEWALEVTKDWTVDDDSTLANDLRMIWQAQAALTATSQPQRGKGDRALTERVIDLEQALEFAVRGLKVAQPIVCSMCCPSVKRTSEPWTHRQPCDSLTLTLRTVEAQLSQPASEPAQHLCGARGFGQSLDDRCPGCDATSQEGQG